MGRTQAPPIAGGRPGLQLKRHDHLCVAWLGYGWATHGIAARAAVRGEARCARGDGGRVLRDDAKHKQGTLHDALRAAECGGARCVTLSL